MSSLAKSVLSVQLAEVIYFYGLEALKCIHLVTAYPLQVPTRVYSDVSSIRTSMSDVLSVSPRLILVL